LIAVRLSILTRKTLDGLEGRVLTSNGEALPGLYAAGEVSGFGGGGMHGYNSLEGTILGGLPVLWPHIRALRRQQHRLTVGSSGRLAIPPHHG
jgi:predicted oxidoreductase